MPSPTSLGVGLPHPTFSARRASTALPVGYGATHPVASNKSAAGRDFNRHVDVKVLVNKSVGQGM